jgi:HAD superfamily hydrolase (TIGR01509 family)
MSAVQLDSSSIKAIVFDLDNTLVSSNMDFKRLREQIGCPLDLDLLSYIDELDCPIHTAKAHQMILQHELDDAQHSHPMPGCQALLNFIQKQSMHTAIITRNCEQAAKQKVAQNQLDISRIISREHFPPKPAPDSLLALATEWSLKAEQILYVGDYLYDLQAAYNAKMPSCLVTHGTKPRFSQHASLVVDYLDDIIEVF